MPWALTACDISPHLSLHTSAFALVSACCSFHPSSLPGGQGLPCLPSDWPRAALQPSLTPPPTTPHPPSCQGQTVQWRDKRFPSPGGEWLWTATALVWVCEPLPLQPAKCFTVQHENTSDLITTLALCQQGLRSAWSKRRLLAGRQHCVCVCVHVCVDKQRCRLVLLLTELQESISRAAAGPSSLPTERSQNPRLKALNNSLQFHSVYAAPLSTGSASKDGLRALHCLSHLPGLWPRTQTHTRSRASRKPSPQHLALPHPDFSFTSPHLCAGYWEMDAWCEVRCDSSRCVWAKSWHS